MDKPVDKSPHSPAPCYCLLMPTIEEMKKKNEEVGEHFFDSATMRFFKSEISAKTFGNYFVTSECGPSGLRRYSVRVFDPETGSITTHGNFQEYETSREAHKVALHASQSTSRP